MTVHSLLKMMQSLRVAMAFRLHHLLTKIEKTETRFNEIPSQVDDFSNTNVTANYTWTG